MTDNTARRAIAVVLAVMAIGGVAVTGIAAADSQTQTDAAADDGDDLDAQQSSYLRVIHAVPDAPAVDVAVDDETMLSDFEYGNASDYLELPAGNHSVTITAADDSDQVLFEGSVYLDARTASTLAAATEMTQDGGPAEAPADEEAQADDGVLDDNETETPEEDGVLDGNETETPEDDAILNGNETETEDGALGANETETPEDDGILNGNETETPEDDGVLDGNETETPEDDGVLDGNETETPEDGAAVPPGENETDAAVQIQPVMYVDNAWEPDDDTAALSAVHLAPDAPAVDVTIPANETAEDGAATTENATETPADDGALGDDETETEDGALGDNETTPADDGALDENETAADDGAMADDETAADGETNRTVVAEDLTYGSASDYVTVPDGEHTLQIREAAPDNDGDVIATVDVTVEGGAAHSAVALAPGNVTEGVAENGTVGENETQADDGVLADNETETPENDTTLGENDTEADGALGANETDDGAMADGETDAVGDNATDGATDAPVMVELTEDVTYTINLPDGEATEPAGPVEEPDAEGDEADEEPDAADEGTETPGADDGETPTEEAGA